MNHMGTQTLRTDRLVLRRYTMDDVDAMYENWAKDTEVTAYLFWDAHPDTDVTREVLGTWVPQYAEAGYYNWGIEMDGVLIGNIAVVDCSDRNEWAEIGYVIGKAYWGRGIMTEALEAVLRYLFETVAVHRICLKHDVENVGSGRVMIKNGLVREGVQRKAHRRRDGSWADLPVYSMLREEWDVREKKA